MKNTYQRNPKLDLVLERTADVPRELVWAAWTQPEHLKKWFTPKPWKTIDAEIDLRPGGVFRTVMQSPEGANMANEGCYLEVIPNEKLVWTSALGRDYRPNAASIHDLKFTAMIFFEIQGKGTKYTVYALHPDETARKQHEAMGFEPGWGAAWEQLVALVKQGL